jgi:hypothetical protein
MEYLYHSKVHCCLLYGTTTFCSKSKDIDPRKQEQHFQVKHLARQAEVLGVFGKVSKYQNEVKLEPVRISSWVLTCVPMCTCSELEGKV